MKLKTTVALALALSLGGCVALTPQGKEVRITEDENVVKGCQYLGSVRAADRLNGGVLGQDIADRNVEGRLQNRAAEKGGDTVLMKMHSSGISGASGRGEVYRCTGSVVVPPLTPSPPSNPPPSKVE